MGHKMTIEELIIELERDDVLGLSHPMKTIIEKLKEVESGLEDAAAEAADQAYQEGYDEGYEVGHDEGYDEGFSDGQEVQFDE